MTEQQVKDLNDIAPDKIYLRGDMLENQKDRTLLWGYTVERASFHVYLLDGVLHLYIYDRYSPPVRKTEDDNLEPQEWVPDKRLYPEACDYEFCALLKKHGAWISFTTYNPNRKPADFYGEIF